MISDITYYGKIYEQLVIFVNEEKSINWSKFRVHFYVTPIHDF